MATRKALGRGLSALIPSRPTSDPEMQLAGPFVDGRPFFISVERIVPNPAQPRKSFNEGDLSALAASIQEQGVLQPLVVRRRDDDSYELIIGERRWRAAQIVGLSEVPAVILDASDRAVVEMALVENVQRADLNPMELGHAFQVLIDQEGMTQEEVGRRVGLDRSSIANHIRLFELEEDIQHDLISQRLTMGHAKAILQCPAEQRTRLRDQIVRGGLSVRAAEDLARRTASNAKSGASRAGPGRDVHVAALEDRLRQSLQTKVRLVGRRGRGRIELHYFGEAELERLSDRLLGGEA